jgi:3-deoxy-7-phosphoheptulonate synthase
MKLHSTREEVDEVRKQVEHFGYKVHSIEGEERVVIGVVGIGDVTACLESVEAMPQVEKVVPISAPYKFVSKEFRKGKTRINIRGTEIGGDEFMVMAGPCSVESEKQIMQAAEGVAQAGAKMLRGGAFKPRTSPYDFQGMEEEGLKLLQKAREQTGLAIITEVMSDRDVDLIAQYADVMQVGARNMQNFILLKALGKCRRPVLLKRGLSSTIKELLMSAEYIVAHGNAQHLRYRGHSSAQRVDTFTSDSRSQPCHRKAQPRAGTIAGRGSHRRRRLDRRGSSRAGKSHQRWRPVSRPRPVPKNDAGPAPLHGFVESGEKKRTGIQRRGSLTNQQARFLH